MKRNVLSLGRIAGIPVGVDYSWFLIFILFSWILSVSYFPSDYPAWPAALSWVIGVSTTLLLFVSVLLHEFGHYLVARYYKIPVKNITLLIFGGVSQIEAEPPTAMAEFWIASAGPGVSLALAGIFYLLQHIPGMPLPLVALLKYLAYINGTLALFNLIPGFPLDGGRVFRSIIWGITHNLRRATIVAANTGRVIAFLFILFGVWQMINGSFGNGLWIVLIGWYLQDAAASQVLDQTFHDLLAGRRVADAMHRDFISVQPDCTLEQLFEEHILGSGQRSMMVEQDGKVVGLLTLHNVKEVPRPDWINKTAGSVMVPLEQLKWIRPDAELYGALEKMDRDGVNQLPVMMDGQMQGMLGRDDIISVMRSIREITRQGVQ